MREFHLPYIDFVGKRKFFLPLSGISVLVSILLFIFVGPNWSIDFTGGTEVQIHLPSGGTAAEIRTALQSSGIGDDSIQQLGPDSDGRFVVRVQGASEASPEEVESVKSALITAFGADWIDEFRLDAEVGTRASVYYKGEPLPMDRIQQALAGMPEIQVQPSPEDNTFYLRLPGLAEEIRDTLTAGLGGKAFEIERVDSVGPKVGDSLRLSGLTSMAITMLMLLIYVAFRFDFTFAPGAILCLFHDVALVCGIWVIFRLEFGLPMISALLTLVGYSLNDTIVIYDRIRENMEKYRRQQLAELLNDSMNQMLTRTIMTSAATALALLFFLLWGGPVLQNFAIAMLVGMVFGSYSTIYIASPMMLVLKENQHVFQRFFGGGAGSSPSSAKP